MLCVGSIALEHQRVMIVRDEAKQLKGITDRIIEIVGHRKGFNSGGGAWTNPVPNCLIDLLGIPNIGDETKRQCLTRFLGLTFRASATTTVSVDYKSA